MKKTEYYPLAKERNGMQKLQFREYKNKTIKSQKEKYKNFTNKHYYGFDHKSLSVHMNPESLRAKESNKLIKIEKGRMKIHVDWVEKVSRSFYERTHVQVFIQEKENIRKRKGGDATFEHVMKISRMNEQIKWLRSELNK